ncbi:rhox homeobox family member 2 [Sigmodon hispidus]
MGQTFNRLPQPEEDEENWNGHARMVFLAVEGRPVEVRAQGWPRRRTAAAAEREGAGELRGEGPSAAAAAAGLVDDGNQEGHGARENEEQPQEPVHEDMEDDEAVPVPVPVPVPAPVRAPRRKRSRFTKWQLQKLETVFQHTHYIKASVRKRLATRMGVSEAQVQDPLRLPDIFQSYMVQRDSEQMFPYFQSSLPSTGIIPASP